MPGIKVGEAFVDLTMPTASFVRDTVRAGNSFKKFVGSTLNQAALLSSVFIKLGGALTVGTTVPFFLFGRRALAAASNVQEMENLTSLAFQGSAASAREWAADFAKSARLANSEIIGTATQFQQFISSSGIATKVAAGMSTELAELTVHLQSALNLQAPEVLAKFTSALAGQSEAVARLGINVRVQGLQQLATTLGIKQSVEAMSEQQKILLRYAAILQGTNRIQGDFFNTQNTFANLGRQISGQFLAIGEALGNVLLPAFTAVRFVGLQFLAVFRSIAEVFGNLPKPIRFAIGGLFALAAAIGPVLLAIGLLAKAYGLWLLVTTGAHLVGVAFNFVLQQMAAFQLTAGAASAIGAATMSLFAGATTAASIALRAFLISIPLVGAALIALNFLFDWLLGSDTTAGIKDLDEKLAGVREQIEGMDSSAKSLAGTLNVLSSLNVRAALGTLGQPSTSPASSSIGPPLPSPIGSVSSSDSGGLNQYGNLIVEELQGMRVDLVRSQGFQ